MKALVRIAEIETELIGLGNQSAQFALLEKLCRSEKVRTLLAERKARVRLRIARAQNEISALENAYFAEIQTARRDAKYPPIKTVTLRMKIL
jgi:hypothetical protein